MKYSFLLPAFKGGFLKEALSSLQAQTFVDFVVLVSDDCSPEPIYDIVRPFLSDSRFMYRRNDINIGAAALPSHWNLILEQCESPYVVMAGDDDIYDPRFLEEIDKLVLQFPQVNLLRAVLDKIDSNGTVIETEQAFSPFQDSQQFIYELFDKRHQHGVGQFVFKTSYLKSVGGFYDLPLAWFSDDATAIIASKQGVAHTSSVLFHARISDSSISGQPNSTLFVKMKAKSINSFYLWFKSFLKEQDLSPQKRYDLRKQCRIYCYDRIMNVYYGLSIKDRLITLSTFPFFSWMSIKNRINLWIKQLSNR